MTSYIPNKYLTFQNITKKFEKNELIPSIYFDQLWTLIRADVTPQTKKFKSPKSRVQRKLVSLRFEVDKLEI